MTVSKASAAGDQKQTCSLARYEGLRKRSRENNEFTKECIKQAMLALAGTKHYKDISVTELCKKAGVSRMAFYRNYAVITDVFREIACDLNEAVILSAGSPFRMKTTREWYVQVFQLIRENKDAMSLMFEEPFQYQWMKLVNSYAVHDERFPQEQKYQRLMWSGGFENAVSYWLNNQLKETPEEMADYCFTYLPHLLYNELEASEELQHST